MFLSRHPVFFLSARVRGFVESRRHPRYPVRLPVAFWGNAASGQGHVIDLSVGGCGVESDVPLTSGQNLRMYVVTPASHNTVIIDVAPVRWAQGRRFGVEFVKIQPASEEILSQWLAKVEGEAREA